MSLPADFTTGSSIMPQKRNPDVFELMRGRSAVAQAALNEVLGITQKLTSGYHRDLQLIKPPLFRGIDSCLQTLAILPSALDGVRFSAGKHPAGSRAFTPPRRPMRWSPKQGIPFREAYRQVAAKLKDSNEHLAQLANPRGIERQRAGTLIETSGHLIHRDRRGLRARHHARGRAHLPALWTSAWRRLGGARRNPGQHGRGHVRRCGRVSGRGPGNQRQPCARRAHAASSPEPHDRCTSAAAPTSGPSTSSMRQQNSSAFRALPWRSSSAARCGT